MAVTVGTDSYGDEDGLTAYATARGITITGDKTQLLIQAMDWLEIQPWISVKYDYEQSLAFPRYYTFYDDDSGVVPTDIVNAQYVAALIIDGGGDLNATITQAVKREKVDVLEVEYQTGSSQSPYYPRLIGLVSRYLSSSGGSFTVNRG